MVSICLSFLKNRHSYFLRQIWVLVSTLCICTSYTLLSGRQEIVLCVALWFPKKKTPLRCSPLATSKEASICAHSNLCQMLFVSIGWQRRKGQGRKRQHIILPNKIIRVLYYCSLKEPINTWAQTSLWFYMRQTKNKNIPTQLAELTDLHPQDSE